MKKIVLLTGANGHLGRTIALQLRQNGVRVRGLVLPGENTSQLDNAGVEVFRGDVRDTSSLKPLFAGLAGYRIIVIHAAAIIDITSDVSKLIRDVNVSGTKNMVALALNAQVARFLHVSSVHAIPEAPGCETIAEVKRFSPTRVSGGYAKTKAEASQYVITAIEKHGLPGIILHPSGIMGPGDNGTNHIVAALREYVNGHTAACPRGGYNMVDVRDVATAVITAIDKGRIGETYILSGKHYELSQIFAMTRAITGKGRPCTHIPMWVLKLAAPIMERKALRKNEKPLLTPYSLKALCSNDNFTHEKATRELDFHPRDFYETLRDTLAEMTPIGN